MTFKEFLKKHKVTATQFSEESGMGRATFYRWFDKGCLLTANLESIAEFQKACEKYDKYICVYDLWFREKVEQFNKVR